MSDMLDPGLARLAKSQNFTMVQVHRSQINPAPYNPRKIDPYAKKKLASSIKTFGLVEPLVWNRRTGVLVGGHQRLNAMDEREKDLNYRLDVAAIDVDEKTERELNVALNNPDLQGQYDEDRLAELVRDKTYDFNIENAGFDPMSFQVLLDATGNDELFSLEKQPESVQTAVMGAEELAAKQKHDKEKREAEISNIKESKKKHRERVRERDDTEFVAVVVFKNRFEQTKFVEAIGCDSNARYVDGFKLLNALGISTEPEETAEEEQAAEMADEVQEDAV